MDVTAPCPPEPPLAAPTDEELLAHVEQFLAESKIPPTRFGIEALREGGLVASLRKGRSLSLKSANKVLGYIAEWKRDNAAAGEPSATKAGENIRSIGEADSLRPFPAAGEGSCPICFSSSPRARGPSGTAPSLASSTSIGAGQADAA
jgi:hypothetical protein